MQNDRTRSDPSLVNALKLAKITRFHWSIVEWRLLSWDYTYEEMMGVRADVLATSIAQLIEENETLRRLATRLSSELDLARRLAAGEGQRP